VKVTRYRSFDDGVVIWPAYAAAAPFLMHPQPSVHYVGPNGGSLTR
jgi:hypothetical protein